MAGLAGLMKDLPKLKARMEEMKERLGEVEVEAETGGGAVRARANGKLRIVEIKIDPALMAGLVDAANEDDRAMAEDLVTGAVNAALQKAREAAEEHMAEVASEMGLPMPPGGLGGLMS
ncbi:MAG: YbaB/EbfC family nucleoid-associated protein [Phycisphaerales bacterium]|nr:MAG: YbaB/EbfC family nucleoid-associated protein [Phycisphaerales bacterium]